MAMFKKATSVAFKGETRLRGKEAKQLKEVVAVRFGSEDIANTLFPAKADIILKKVGGGSSTQFVFVDSDCVLIQPDARAKFEEAEFIPTLQALWKVKEADLLLPVVVIARPVAPNIHRGAALMAPGVVALAPSRAGQPPTVNKLVAIIAHGNPSACAVGYLKMSIADLKARQKGEAVSVVHHFGDCLWEATGKTRPEGFVGEKIEATQADAEADDDDDEDDEEEKAAASGEEGKNEVGDEDKGKDTGKDFCPPPRATDSTSKNEAASDAGSEAEDTADEGTTPEAMSLALWETFLQAAKTRLKDKDLPMTGNLLYAQHLRPCRRAGTHLDVKASSHKKLATFMQHCEAEGLIALKKNSADPIVTKICRDHPELRDFKPWPKAATAEFAEPTDAAGGGGASGSRAPAARIEVELVWNVARLKAFIEALGSANSHLVKEDQCWTRQDCIEAVRSYVSTKDLWQKQNKKRVDPDDLLRGFLSKAPADQTAFSVDGLADAILAGLPVCHRVAIPRSGAAGGIRRTVRTGKPPSVQVRTDTRRGHSVTLIHGLEAYGVDMEAFAAHLQKALATSAAVEEASGSTQAGLMVQGFWNDACADWLTKIGIPSECVQNQAKKGQNQKKAKQASNIVKS